MIEFRPTGATFFAFDFSIYNILVSFLSNLLQSNRGSPTSSNAEWFIGRAFDSTREIFILQISLFSSNFVSFCICMLKNFCDFPTKKFSFVRLFEEI